MALSRNLYRHRRLYLTATEPLRGFWVDAGQKVLDRNLTWEYREGVIRGDWDQQDQVRLAEFAVRLEETVKRYRRQGEKAFLKLSGVTKVDGPSWSL